MGNGYGHGDSHGQYMEHQIAYGSTNMGYGNGADVANQYSAPDAHDHLTGYDSVKANDNDDYDTSIESNFRDAINTAIDTVQTARAAKITEVMNTRRNRLEEIHDDNLLKIEAPFDLQLDLLEEELSDVQQAKAHAVTDANDAFADLQERL